jgi:dTDP-4-dehydrorhamnose 3,5-epimerase
MNVLPMAIHDVKVLEPRVHSDARGFFFESYNATSFTNATGITAEFVQDNHSHSVRGVLRGLHYQWPQPQGKLIRVIHGRVLDVAVDLRRSSPSFGQWVSVELVEERHQQLWIPSGFAHGFVVLSDRADVVYKTTDYYAPEHERCIRWDDATLAIDWQITGAPLISPKDAAGRAFEDAVTFP